MTEAVWPVRACAEEAAWGAAVAVTEAVWPARAPAEEARLALEEVPAVQKESVAVAEAPLEVEKLAMMEARLVMEEVMREDQDTEAR